MLSVFILMVCTAYHLLHTLDAISVVHCVPENKIQSLRVIIIHWLKEPSYIDIESVLDDVTETLHH